MDTFITIPGQVSPHFRAEEFKCKCGCGGIRVSQRLIEMLEQLRQSFGGPLTINSGYRCPAHNAEASRVERSAHVLGYAADIRAIDGHTRFLLIDKARQVGFVRLGVAGTFIHVDCDPTKPQEVIWTY